MKKPLMTLGVEEKPEMKSPIDSLIVDLILEHFNVQSLEGRDEILTGDQFSELIKLAEGMYYEEVTKHQKLGLA